MCEKDGKVREPLIRSQMGQHVLTFLRSEVAGHSNVLYLSSLATGFFLCMVIMELALEAASTHYHSSFGSLTSTVTLFQFGFCIGLPMLIEGPTKIARNFPKTVPDALPYVKLSLAVFGATALATHSLHYVSYPTKVVFKSAKLIPTMVVATVMNRATKYSVVDYWAALLLCAGAAGYSWGSGSAATDDHGTSLIGIVLLSTSILCDAFVPNFQHSLMAGTATTSPLPDHNIKDTQRQPHHGLTAAELMVNVNSVGFIGLLLYMIVSGSLVSAVSLGSDHPMLLLYLVTIGTGLSVAVFCYTKLIQGAGSVVAVAVATLRKVATVVLSYLFFPKPLHSVHVVSGLLVLAGILLNAYTRQRSKG